MSDRRSIVVWLGIVAHDVSLLHSTIKSGNCLCRVECQHFGRGYDDGANSYVSKGAI